jgi:hypothetical protein
VEPVRGAAGLRVAVFAGAFFAASMAFCFSSFSFSRASYSSLDGNFKVIRFSPEVRASISSFSLPFAVAVLLAKFDGMRGTGGR